MDLMRNLVNRTEPGSFLFTWLFSGFLICTSAKIVLYTGVMDMSGSAFIGAFLFETPFALMRSFVPLSLCENI